ncbi:chemosensory receptor A [Elysia marginata]|uniref:Chemosensory receptor A n=1 Tax=Elysia marginata TaxID=1093978 RepID=A0AAV4IGD0_9GAST|nr:chemosensory receptor A [Elysia marginata]
MSVLVVDGAAFFANITNHEPPTFPLIGYQVQKLIEYVNALGLVTLTALFGVFTNIANISVYLKMGLRETTNINFFALSVFDLLVCMVSVVAQITNNGPVSQMTMPSGARFTEVAIAAIYITYPCLGCSAWVTAILSVERYLCIATPLKVKDIITPQRTRALILTMVAYQSVFLILFFTNPGPPYDAVDPKRALYFNCSFSAPTFICFFIVVVSTILLVVKLRQNLEWRNESTNQSSKNLGSSKEQKATRSVLAICTIFIACFALNLALFFASLVYPRFTHMDPYLGSLFRVLYSFSTLLQLLSATVNIFVYYKMSTKYREIFTALFCRHRETTG